MARVKREREFEMSRSRYLFSIVIPVLNEADGINSLIEDLLNREDASKSQIIVVDGDPEGTTVKAIINKQVVRLISARGRGCQMNAGVKAAEGGILVFLHADTKLPREAMGKIRSVMEGDGFVGGAFDLHIESDRFFLKCVSTATNWRARLLRIPYGDQAIFIRKNYFDRIGGFKEIPLMEDVELMGRIKKRGDRIFIISEAVGTSARRWEKEGAIFGTSRNLILICLYKFGVSPFILARFYKAAGSKAAMGDNSVLP